MKNRSIIIKQIEIGPNKKDPDRKDVLEVVVDYRLGGLNYMTGTRWGRGYYVSVQPLTVGNGFTSFIGFSGRATCLFEAKRFSQKKLEELTEDLKKNYEEKVQPLVDLILAKIEKGGILFSF